MSRLIKRQAAVEDYSALAEVIGGLSISDLRLLIDEINDVERGGWYHIIPYSIEEIDEFVDTASMGAYELLKQFEKWEFDINDPYFVWDDEQAKSMDKTALLDWIDDSTRGFEELAEVVMRQLGSKSFRDSIPVAVKNAAMELEEADDDDAEE